MQINKTNNVIFLKDIESNIIKEAFIVLKDNINLEKYEDKNEFNADRNNKQINILKEAEGIVNQEIHNSNLKYEKFKILKLEKKIKFLKILNIIIIIAALIYIIIK